MSTTVDTDLIQQRIEATNENLQKIVRNTQLYRDFMVEMARQGVVDPWDIHAADQYSGQYVTLNVYDEGPDEDGKWKREFNAEKSREAIVNFFNAARKYVGNDKVTKDWESKEEFRVDVVLHDDLTVYANVKREAVCVKRVTGKKWVEPKVIEGRWEEEYEWDCDSPSLIAE